MLESFYTARQRYREEEAHEASKKATRQMQESAANQDAANEITSQTAELTDGSLNFYPLDPLLVDLATSCDTSIGLQHKLETLFAW